MKQVIQNVKTGETKVENVPAPKLGRGEVLVATQSSLISAGTERMLLEFTQKSMAGKAKERPDLVKKVLDKMKRDGVAATVRAVFSQLQDPLALGYSAAGVVVEVGSDLTHLYQKGDKVVVAGAGVANHAELNVVPKNLVAKMPNNVSFEHAAFSTVGSIALHGVRNADVKLGDNVLVLGLGLVGQMAAQLAKAAGARVMGLDFDPSRCKLAEDCGADATFALGGGTPDSAIQAFTHGKGFDSILICAATDSNAPISDAAEWARDRANVVLVGMVGTAFPYAAYMKKELNVKVSRSYGPGRYDVNYEEKGQEYPIGWVRWTERENLAEVVRLMGTGDLNMQALITHKFDIENAYDAYELIMEKKEPSLGIILNYPTKVEDRLATRVENEDKVAAKTPSEADSDGEKAKKSVGFGFIGAGAFSRGVLLPNLKKIPYVNLTGVITRTGMSSKSSAKRFGFDFAATSVKDLLEDSATDAVFITTLHNTHTNLVVDALHAGKHVFVEKPLAMNDEDLQRVKKAYRNAQRRLMVGYNRRFAPMVEQLYKQLEKHASGPRNVIYRINAGMLPSDNWQNDPEVGGGRLIGEGCHFIDLALFLMKSKPVEVFTSTGAGQSNHAINIKGEDGSTAQILYTSEGDSSCSKELLEVYSSGCVGVIDNFNSGFFSRGGRKRKLVNGGFIKSLIGGQDKGHAKQLELFVKAIKTGTQAPISPEQLFTTTNITNLAKRSGETGEVVKVK